MIRGILFEYDTMIGAKAPGEPDDNLRVLARLRRDDYKLGLYADRPVRQLQDLPAGLLSCFVFLQGGDGAVIRGSLEDGGSAAWQPVPAEPAGGRTEVLKQFCGQFEIDPAETAVFSGSSLDAALLRQAGTAVSSNPALAASADCQLPPQAGIRAACEHFGWIFHE